MEKKYVAALMVIILILLFITGVFVGNTSIDINGCRAEWKSTSITVGKSELCPSDSCSASPADQQHNAIVNALLCACDKAKNTGYTDTSATARIEEVVQQYFGYNLRAQEMCEQPGMILVRRSYG